MLIAVAALAICDDSANGVLHLEDLHGEKFVLLYANSAVATADTVILEVLQEMMSVAMTVPVAACQDTQ
eukprot:4307884-Amphidinium_carterae.1